jgi:hypothetical protein
MAANQFQVTLNRYNFTATIVRPANYTVSLNSDTIQVLAPPQTRVTATQTVSRVNIVENGIISVLTASDSTVDQFYGDASTSTFQLSKPIMGEQFVEVTVGGVEQTPSVAYTTYTITGTTTSTSYIQFVSAPPAAQGEPNIIARYYSVFVGRDYVGPRGPAGTITINNVQVVSTGDAYVHNVGTPANAVLNIGLPGYGPQGLPGLPGVQGPRGYQGESVVGAQGSPGAQGPQGVQGQNWRVVGSTSGIANLSYYAQTAEIGDTYTVSQDGHGYTFTGDGPTYGFVDIGYLRGNSGAQGFQGVTGVQGAQGLAGAYAAIGYQGYQGAPGTGSNQTTAALVAVNYNADGFDTGSLTLDNLSIRVKQGSGSTISNFYIQARAIDTAMQVFVTPCSGKSNYAFSQAINLSTSVTTWATLTDQTFNGNTATSNGNQSIQLLVWDYTNNKIWKVTCGFIYAAGLTYFPVKNRMPIVIERLL